MLTVFSIPKAFVGHIAVIQRNALGSWIRLGEGIQVILFGDDEGVAEAAREAGAEHVAEIDRNEYGTPLLNSAFSTAARMGRNPLLCYVNGDMMFTDELTRAAALIRKRNFLMVGHRWNVDITEPWDFSDPQWRKKLVAFTRDHGVRYLDSAIDYFVFPRHSKLTIQPPFAIGRTRGITICSFDVDSSAIHSSMRPPSSRPFTRITITRICRMATPAFLVDPRLMRTKNYSATNCEHSR